MQKQITILGISVALMTSMTVYFFASTSVALESPTVRVRFFRPIKEGYKATSQCSGVFTSNSGYLLTNRHCLVGNVLSEEVRSELEKDLGYLPQLNVLKQAKLYVVIDHGVSSPDEQVREASIISAGAEIDLEKIVGREFVKIFKNLGSPNFKVPDPKAMVMQILNDGFGLQSDWLVLRVQGINKTDCLKVAENDDTSVKMIGYPANKAGEHFGDTRLSVAAGEFDQAQLCFKSIAEQKIKDVQEEEKRNQILDLTRLILAHQTPTTAKIYSGMSGGPTLNYNNELVGINRATLPECPNSSFYNPIKNIVLAVNRLALQAGTPSSYEIFDCKTP